MLEKSAKSSKIRASSYESVEERNFQERVKAGFYKALRTEGIRVERKDAVAYILHQAEGHTLAHLLDGVTAGYVNRFRAHTGWLPITYWLKDRFERISKGGRDAAEAISEINRAYSIDITKEKDFRKSA